MQQSTLVRLKENFELKKPIMVVGLPGVGLVGKLVAEHLIDELKAEKVMEVYSPHFPCEYPSAILGFARPILPVWFLLA